MTRSFLLTGAAAAALAMTAAANAETRGVTADEIVFGTHTALSGPVAVWGVPSVEGMKMRFDAVNDAGGINGRMIRLQVEDNEYQVPKAVQAGNKLINRDGIFAMLGALGTPMNNAVLPRQISAGIPNLFPFSSARQMYLPTHDLKFVAGSTYYDQIRAAYKLFAEIRGKTKPCVMHQDTDFGREIEEGAADQAAAMGQSIVAETAHKPTDKDFTAAVTKLRQAECDVVYMGTIVSDTIIPYVTARKMGWNVDFVGSVSTYTSYTAGAKGGVTEGYMSMTSFQIAYEDAEDPAVREWFKTYSDKYGKNPDFPAQIGYVYADLTVKALENAGTDLTLDSFIDGFNQIKEYHDLFGGPAISFAPDKRQGSDESFLSQVQNGRWVRIGENIGY
ncbi:MAG: ABC transporter substrate-binding protein [Minwuia sp.]|uniref:ABC transporter substrate-binding protein n=1 Tax=Minwuia sp. TaxID=2493630 RepID=UPI003A89B794